MLSANWMIWYVIPSFLFTDIGPQLVAKPFKNIYLNLRIKHLTTTEYHPQTNGQVKRYETALVAPLRLYTSSHPMNMSEYVQPLNYKYGTQIHRSTVTNPFIIVPL